MRISNRAFLWKVINIVVYNICTSHCMVFLLALDLAVTPTIEGLKEMQTMAKEKESTLSNSEKIGML